jgi:hypothetical protein
MSYLLHYYGHQWPFPQGASAGPYEEFSGLGFYRPNQAMYRGIYSGVSRTMGDTTFDPTSINLTDPMTLFAILGAGFVLWKVLRGGKRVARGVKRYRRRRQARSRRLRDFEPDLPYGGIAR